MQLISKLVIFAGSVTGITALSATYAYSQSIKSVGTKEEDKETQDKEKSASAEAKELNQETQVAEKELTEDEAEEEDEIYSELI